MAVETREPRPNVRFSPPSPPPRGPPPPPPSYQPAPAHRSANARAIAKSPTPSHVRKLSLTSSTPEQLLRSIRECSRDSYQKIKDFPATKAFHYAATPSAPVIQAFATNQGRSMHSPTANAPAVPSGPGRTRADPTAAAQRAAARAGCGANYARELKRRVHSFFNNLHISITVGSVEEMQHKPTEQTLRIKNNKTGCCVFQVTKSDSGELLTPLLSLKTLFPNSKYLQKSLTDWNRHFQTPPLHWIINFVPRAYLRRGYYLAEDVCEYFIQNPDGCRYKIEYEPIGHDFVVVGNIVPQGARDENPGADWEKREKRKL